MRHHRTAYLNFSELSKYRAFLYGFAALWIMFFHFSIHIPYRGILLPLAFFQSLGNCGVEIFLLLSGFGLYHSMEKDSNIATFYKKRLLRVFLPSFLTMSVFQIANDGTLAEYIGSSTFVGYWFGVKTIWYIPFILTMYLFYPLVHALQKKNTRNVVILLALSLIFSFFSETFHIAGGEVQRGISRIPVFILGCLIAPYVIQKKPLSNKVLPVFLILALVLTVLWKITNKYGYYYFFRSAAYIAYAVLLIAGLCMIAGILVSHKPLHGMYRWISFCGGISLEIYLIFERVLALLQRLPGFQVHPCGNIKLNLASAIITLVLAVLLQSITNSIIKSIESCHIPER